MDMRPGSMLAGRWELEELLATGGMGEVFRAVDRGTGEAVAVKVLRPGTSQGVERFADEIASLRRLDHPNVVRLLAADEHRGVPFLVMELVPGKPLQTLLERRTLTLAELRRVGHEIASALAYAHRHGIVNRDVNPGNILFAEDDSAKLADFGIALVVGSTRITETNVTIGSATYLAPEQITEERIGPPADVYALGLVLIEGFAGEPAFPGPLKEAAIARLARDPVVPDGLPRRWRRLLSLMTDRDPASRPDASEVAAMLEADAWSGDD
jgi:eukaryotic-like serine/threonine-protein kinase